MSELDREPSFVEGLDQGYELGYLKALNKLSKVIEDMKNEAEQDDYSDLVPFEMPDFPTVREG